MSDGRRTGAPALEIKGLNVYYGASHALQGVDLGLHGGVLSVVGRNGMGKTTLCKAIMGLEPTSSGTISFGGQLLNGRTPAEIARLGVGYVPQGRRLWRSLTVDEHLRLVAQSGGAWTVERIYDSFPRLAERKSNGGGQLSGGEQQMLAIGRALLLNPRLLVMDEPTEGLAPVIVSHVEDMLLKLAAEGDIDVLVIEQNIGVATSVADTVAVMVNGRVSRIVSSRELAADRDLQQRLLGVGQHAHDEDTESAPTKSDTPAGSLIRQYKPASHPLPQVTRWSAVETAGKQPVTTASESEPAGILVLGSMDRYGSELRSAGAFLRQAGLRVMTVDTSTRPGPASSADVPAHQLAAWHPRGAAGIHDGMSPDPRLGVAVALERFLKGRQGIEGVLAILDLGEAATLVSALAETLDEVPIMAVTQANLGELNIPPAAGRVQVFPAHGEESRSRAINGCASALAELARHGTGPDVGTRDTGHVALISGLAGDAVASAVTAKLGRTYRFANYAPTRSGLNALKRALSGGTAKAVVDLDQSDFAAQLFGGVIDTVPGRVAEICTASRPYITVLGGSDRIYSHHPDRRGVSVRRPDRTEAEAIGKAYAHELNTATGQILAIVPTEQRGSPASWTNTAFVAALKESGNLKLLHSSANPQADETMQHLAHALDSCLTGGTSGRRMAAGTAYGAGAS